MALTNPRQTSKNPPTPPEGGNLIFPSRTARNLSAAEIAGLPRLETCSVKEVADAANLTPETIRERLKLWIDEPTNPRAIPFFVALGKPYQIPAQWCRDHLLTLSHQTAND